MVVEDGLLFSLAATLALWLWYVQTEGTSVWKEADSMHAALIETVAKVISQHHHYYWLCSFYLLRFGYKVAHRIAYSPPEQTPSDWNSSCLGVQPLRWKILSTNRTRQAVDLTNTEITACVLTVIFLWLNWGNKELLAWPWFLYQKSPCRPSEHCHHILFCELWVSVSAPSLSQVKNALSSNFSADQMS